jgi:hypothetical protein
LVTGIPRKQIDDVSNQIVIGIESIVEKNQPKRDGDKVDILTPFGTYGLIRFGAQNQVSPEGIQVVRPTCIGMNVSLPRRFINAANIGLIDKATEEAETKKAKSA